MQNLIAVALSVIKSKAAASRYETMVTAHAFTGSEAGEIGTQQKAVC